MLCKKESIFLKNISVENNIVKYDFNISDGLKKYFNRNYLLIEFPKEITLDKIPNSILVIPFVSSIIPLMWLTNSIMWIKEIDRSFYHSLFRIKNAYQEIYDYYPLKGSLIPANLIDNTYVVKRESLILFSGGLDAHTTYLRHIEDNPVLFNIQGWYKDSLNENISISNKDIQDISIFAQNEGKQFLYAKSNFATLINIKYFHKKIEKRLKDTWWHGFQHSMAFISIAIPICYYFGIKKIYIASSFSLGDFGRCASYPTTDSEFLFANVGYVSHDGFELTRQDKVKIIVDYQKKSKKPYFLKVCTFKEKNCCICEKCIRTILGIIAENGNPRDFGFEIETSILDHFQSRFLQNLVFFDVEGESIKHWIYIKERMRNNYIDIKEKEFVEWFLNMDFISLRKKMILKYRIKNFPHLLLKRIKKEVKI